MTSGIRLLALIAVIALCVWLGFLLGKGTQNEIVSAESLQTVAPVASEDSPPALEPSVYPSDSLTNGPANVSERVNQLGARIDFLAAQTDDKVIAKERYLVLSDLSRELKGADADAFASVVRYYNTVVPRDGAGIILEAQYFEGLGLLPDALDLLIDASEFPESNEQLLLIHNAQAEVIGDIYKQHAANDDWEGLIDYFESLLLRDPNNDRIRLYLVNAQAESGNIDAALATLEITGTESGVEQSEINELREELRNTLAEPIKFRSDGNSLIADATLNSTPIALLVDTGASKTALATSVLRQLGAVPLNESAEVMTAAGRITARLYQVPELVVEQTLFRNTTVLALDNPPANWDGLLGMDLLRDMNVDLSNQLEVKAP